jgi:hypothetical protein
MSYQKTIEEHIDQLIQSAEAGDQESLRRIVSDGDIELEIPNFFKRTGVQIKFLSGKYSKADEDGLVLIFDLMYLIKNPTDSLRVKFLLKSKEVETIEKVQKYADEFPLRFKYLCLYVTRSKIKIFEMKKVLE